MSQLSTGRKLQFALTTLVVLLAGGLECGQRISDWRISSRRAGRAVNPYSIRAMSASGAELSDRWGPVVLEHHPYLIYKARPSQETSGLQRLDADDPGVEVHIRINSLGFRGPDWPAAKPAGVRRVAIFGGSAAFGQGATGEATTPAGHLERLLAERAAQGGPGAQGARTEVLNVAQIGYNSDQERILLASEVVGFSPDVIVLLDAWNDFFYSAIRPDRSGDLPDDSPLRRVQPMFDEFDRHIVRGRERAQGALRLSAFYRALERRMDAASPGRLKSPSDRDEASFFDRPRAAATYGRNVAAMIRIGRAFGARTVVAPQPEPFQRAEPLPERQKKMAAALSPAWGRLARERYPTFVEAARAAAAAEGARFADCSRAFDGRPQASFLDQVHFDDEGGRAIAELLVPEVEAALAARAE